LAQGEGNGSRQNREGNEDASHGEAV
jgi:hypothetical protein